MSFVSERDVIRQRLATNWGSTTAIAWDGFNQKPYDPQDGVEFIRPHIEDGESNFEAISVGYQKERKYGVLVIQVFTPIGTGDARGNALCDLLIQDFYPFSSNGVRFDRRGYARETGADGLFHTWLVYLPYYREETVAS